MKRHEPALETTHDPGPRFRFAPSPTGNLHLGNGRTALLAWLQARSHGGVLVLRVDDLDPGRVRESYTQTQLDDLRWLGLDWDEGPDVRGSFGPYLQSRRASRYDEALDDLRGQGLIYPCRCSRKEILAAAAAPHEGEEGPAYPGTCLRHPPGSGTHALRFRVHSEPVHFEDLVQGHQTFSPAGETGDFVVRRKDGVAAYQLATVVDDAAMRISHVTRGADLLSSTARQILLYRALRLPEPTWAHVPLMLDFEGDRLAKRRDSLTLQHLRRRGCSPEKLVGWLAHTCGLLPDSVEATPGDLVVDFEIGRVPRENTATRLPDWITAFDLSDG